MAITLKAARVNAGLDQVEAGKLIGVSARMISLWENGKSFPSVAKVQRIEKAYNISYSDIIFLPQNIGLTDK